jgi:hypothetical protein
MTQPIIHDDQPDRREVFAAINGGLEAGLPAPQSVNLYPDHAIPTASITLDSLADLCAWRDHFGMQKRSVDGQPYPSLTDPTDMEIWSVSVWMEWRGWHLRLNAQDPIADEQIAEWFNSGQAARFAEPEPAPVVCSPECQEQPEERPCLDSCPAQRAARGES